MNPIEEWQDGFGNQRSRGEKNLLGLPSFNPFSTERYRFIENSTRIDDPDANSTRFTDRDKDFLIEPQAGDVLEFKTAEAPRYVPGFDASPSWAFNFETFLQDETDRVDFFVEGSYELRLFGDGTAQLAAIEGGSDNVVEETTLPRANTAPYRPELTFNWYDVGRAEWSVDYTVDGKQYTDSLGSLSDDTDWMADSPVGRVGVRLDVANSGIQLKAGSMQYLLHGDIDSTGRPKPFTLTSGETNQIAATGYTVVAALRIDPNRSHIYTQLESLFIDGEQSVDTELWAKAVSASETDADFIDVRGDASNAGPAVPRALEPENSVIQWTPNVSTFPTRTDAVTGNTIPAGRSVGLATDFSAGQGNTTSSATGFNLPRPIYPDDVVLLIGHTPDVSNTQDVDIYAEVDEDW